VRPKGVADGQPVNIPALACSDQDRRGDADSSLGKAMVSNPRGEEIRIGKSVGSSAGKSL
jgi:hypothetical protein